MLAVSLLIFSQLAMAAAVSKNAQVAVMDLGIHSGACSSSIADSNYGIIGSEYIISRLINRKVYTVMDKELVRDRIREQGLNMTGLIDPDTAVRLGKNLHTQYLLYGNVNDITVSDTGTSVGSSISGGMQVNTVKAHIILRMLDVKTGCIVGAAKGEGRSRSTKTEVGSDKLGMVSIGVKKVPQVSVHNALEKAAYNAVDILLNRLYGMPLPKKKEKL